MLFPAISVAIIGLIQGAGVSQGTPNPNGKYPDVSRDVLGQGAANGRPIWDFGAYPFLEQETAPPSVDPSLMRQSCLVALYHGLFQVTEGVYQIRGFDLSVMSIIQTDSGYVVIDPLISAQTAKAGMELVYRHLGQRPVVAVIYTHSHVDHWGGVKGVISAADVKAGKVKVIAPEHFLENAISENIIQRALGGQGRWRRRALRCDCSQAVGLHAVSHRRHRTSRTGGDGHYRTLPVVRAWHAGARAAAHPGVCGGAATVSQTAESSPRLAGAKQSNDRDGRVVGVWCVVLVQGHHRPDRLTAFYSGPVLLVLVLSVVGSSKSRGDGASGRMR